MLLSLLYEIMPTSTRTQRHMHPHTFVCSQNQQQTQTHMLCHRCFYVTRSQFYAPHTCSYILHFGITVKVLHIFLRDSLAAFQTTTPSEFQKTGFRQSRRGFTVSFYDRNWGFLSLLIHPSIILLSFPSFPPAQNVSSAFFCNYKVLFFHFVSWSPPVSPHSPKYSFSLSSPLLKFKSFHPFLTLLLPPAFI